jgi:membrane fusion protein (multidrug efflux system)
MRSRVIDAPQAQPYGAHWWARVIDAPQAQPYGAHWWARVIDAPQAQPYGAKISKPAPAALCAALALFGCAKPDQGAAGKRPPPLVAVAAVVTKDVPVEVRAPIDLRPLEQAEVSSKTLGYLDAVLVDRGDKVRRGQLLALVRPSDLPDQLAAARQQLAQAQAQSAFARSSHKRAESLAPSGVVSQQDLQQAQASLDSTAASEQSARAQIAALATRLGETRILSPFDGYVLQRRLDPGALVGQAGGNSGSILTVARLDELRVFVTVNEREAGSVRMGQPGYVELDAYPGKRFHGSVVRLSPAFDPNTRTMDAEVRLHNPGDLRPGMYGRGAIEVDLHPHAVVAPVNAVQISNGKSYVFVAEGDRVRRRPVDLGVDHGEWLEIKRGLSAGEKVVIAGADGLSDNAQVRVVDNINPFTGATEGAVPQAAGNPEGRKKSVRREPAAADRSSTKEAAEQRR